MSSFALLIGHYGDVAAQKYHIFNRSATDTTGVSSRNLELSLLYQNTVLYVITFKLL